MKVLHLVGKSSGGIRQHVNTLNVELKNLGIDSNIIAPVGTMEGLRPAEYTYQTPRLSNPISIISCARQVSGLVEKNDLLHAHGLIPAIVALLAKRFRKINIPVVMTMHNLVEKQLEGSKYLLKYKIEKTITSRVDYIICPSEYAQSHAQNATNNKIETKVVLPIGKKIVAADVNEAKAHRIATRDEYNIDQQDLLCVSLSRYVKQKDIPTLIKSFELVVEKIPKAKLIVAGHGSCKNIEEYEKLIEQLGLEDKISLYSNIENTERLIACADLFVLSSIYETVPLVLIEALEFGLPVVMTQVGIANTILDGETGTSVPIKNKEELSKAIVTWLNKVEDKSIDYKILADSILGITSVENTVEPIIEIYQSLIRKKTSE